LRGKISIEKRRKRAWEKVIQSLTKELLQPNRWGKNDPGSKEMVRWVTSLGGETHFFVPKFWTKKRSKRGEKNLKKKNTGHKKDVCKWGE